MANKSLLGKVPLSFSHLPTGLLIIGYPVYWLELYFLRNNFGQTTPLALVLFFLLCVWTLSGPAKDVGPGWLKGEWKGSSLSSRIFLGVGAGIALGILLCALYAALLPPHLIQESDALNYHYTLPRQHLILNSFQHIPWSSADLFPLPLQFALAPYWFVTALPNKFPQFFFLLGIMMVVHRLTRYFAAGKLTAVALALFAVLGSHNVGIQMGTAMLDLMICYLFLASLDSFLNGNTALAAIEFSFFLWSKSFIPFQVILIAAVMFLSFKVMGMFNFKTVSWEFGRKITLSEARGYLSRFRKLLVAVAALSLLIGGPFVVKSLYYSGTPLYPFGAGLLKLNEDQAPAPRQPLLEAARSHIAMKDKYGYGHSAGAFLKHFWLMAVPDEGVNNKFDYPVGLPYLLFVGPFLYFLCRSFSRKVFPVIPLFIAVYWLVWWAGTQQTRFLYIPIILMFIMVVAGLKEPSFILKGAVLLALLFNLASVASAHRGDWGREPLQMLREQDRNLIALNGSYIRQKEQGYIDLAFGDAAFAQFPVNATVEKLPFIIQY